MERLTKIGKIIPKSAEEIKESRIGLGMEKLDRDSFNPEKAYDKVKAIGVKWIRLQSGWQKTERTKGIYDFSWLDSQVNSLLERKMEPWLCLCYGNPIYDALAKEYIGSVGCPPIRTEEAYSAWLKYVKATAEHFKGRITYYEIWNEPEGGWTWRPEPNPEEYAEFCIKTAEAVKQADTSAKIITGSHYDDTMEHFNREFAAGTITISDAVSYHIYNYDEGLALQRVEALKGLLKYYGSEKTEIIQGECGSQSESGGNGALSWVRCDEQMQTKYLLRHVISDLLSGVKFTSVFSCVDMAENLDAKEGAPITTCGYFGMLGADFDPKTGNVIGAYREKMSYYALQNMCSIFDENVNPVYISHIIKPMKSDRIDGFDCKAKEIICGGLEKKNGAKAFVYWNTTDMITVKDYEGTASFEISGVKGKVRLIDPMDGSIYELPETIMKDNGSGLYYFKNIAIKDYPLILTFGEFYTEESR